MDRQENLTTEDLASGRRTNPDAAAREQRSEPVREQPAEPAGEQRAEPVRAPRAEPTRDTGPDGQAQPLVTADEATDYRGRWESVQAGFVDEPRSAVESADALVADLMQRLADTFARERKDLEGQWDRGDDVSTEDLRLALQRYRSFFDRLLTT